MSHPASSKSLYFLYKFTSDCSPGEIPLTRYGNQTKRSLNSVRKPGRLLLQRNRCQYIWYLHYPEWIRHHSLHRLCGPPEVDELAQQEHHKQEERQREHLSLGAFAHLAVLDVWELQRGWRGIRKRNPHGASGLRAAGKENACERTRPWALIYGAAAPASPRPAACSEWAVDPAFWQTLALMCATDDVGERSCHRGPEMRHQLLRTLSSARGKKWHVPGFLLAYRAPAVVNCYPGLSSPHATCEKRPTDRHVTVRSRAGRGGYCRVEVVQVALRD